MLQLDQDSSQADHSPHSSSACEKSPTMGGKKSADGMGYNNLEPNEPMSHSSSGFLEDLHCNPINSRSCEKTSSPIIVDNQSGIFNTEDLQVAKYTSYSELLQHLAQEAKMVILQYSQVVGDSEMYEQQAAQAVTDLTAHGQLFLRNLNNQKQMLCRRINSISEALKNEY